MDKRDKQLIKHMKQRLDMATELPIEKQRRWAQKCVAIAALQQRIAFYMSASIWLSRIEHSSESDTR